MRAIEKIVTNDGVEHNSERDARKHCEEMLGQYLCKLSHKLVHIDSYSSILAFIESNLETFHLAYCWQMESKESLLRD